MSKILTPASLQHCTIAQLRALHRKAQLELTSSAEGTTERRNALASLENISRQLRAKLAHSAPHF